MRIAILLKVALFFSVITLPLSQAYSQDTGIPDTVWIENAVGQFGSDGPYGIAIPFSLNIHVFNDAALRNIVIPLRVDGYSGWARFDSVSFIGSRLAGTTILPERQAYSFWTDSLSLDSLVLAFS